MPEGHIHKCRLCRLGTNSMTAEGIGQSDSGFHYYIRGTEIYPASPPNVLLCTGPFFRCLIWLTLTLHHLSVRDLHYLSVRDLTESACSQEDGGGLLGNPNQRRYEGK